MGKSTMVRALPVAMEPRGPRAAPTWTQEKRMAVRVNGMAACRPIFGL
jgi:hypothetical protein